MRTTLLDNIRAVAFDAVGTVIDPEPRPAAVYHEIGCRHGSRLPMSFISSAFREAFAHQERHDQSLHQATSEPRERERWQAIVGAVLHDVTDREACFQELWQHFARPDKWKLLADVEALFAELSRRELKLAVASNFDGRLRPVLAGLSASQRLDEIVISSEVGWKKPAPQFFAELARRLQCEPGEILFVGDHLGNDYEGASAAGLRAVLLDPGRKQLEAGCRRIDRLIDLLADSAPKSI
jgi:putative hydrolase of the HAD superfamily